jgi:FdhE protein
MPSPDHGLQQWLEANPFLVPLARFQGAVAQAAAATPAPALALPSFDAHAQGYAEGVPLLRSASHGPALAAAGAAVLGDLAARVAEAPLPAKLVEGIAEVRAALGTEAARQAATAWLVAGADEATAPVQAGLLRFLGWTAMGRLLAPLSTSFAAWRDDAAWRRPTCPTCGQLPVMAQLVTKDDGRQRVLVCGCCPTRWGFMRLGCPYCGNEDPQRLNVLELQGPSGLRLDVCESCRGYMKTYAGAGQEVLLLADWTTLVLDAMAAERGYQRRGASLFEL